MAYYAGDQVNAGTYTVTATYAGDANHLGSSGRHTITIGKAAFRRRCHRRKLHLRRHSPHRRVGRGRGAGTVTATAVLTYTGDQVNAGTYTVTATYAGDANHLGSTRLGDDHIDKAAAR